VIKPDLELCVFICVIKLLTEAWLVDEVEAIFELCDSVVEGMRIASVRSELELLLTLVATADPLKFMPSIVALVIEEFVHPLGPIELADRGCGVKVDIASAPEVFAGWTAEWSTFPKGMSEILVLWAIELLVNWPSTELSEDGVADMSEVEAEEAEAEAVREMPDTDPLAVTVQRVLVPELDVVAIPENNEVLLIGKKLPGKTLGCKSALVPAVAEDAALPEMDIVVNSGLWVWDEGLPELVVSETTKMPLEVELRDAELEKLAYEVAVEVSSMLLRTEGVVDGSRTTTLEEVTEDIDADVDSSTTSDLLLLGKIRVAVGKAEPSPSPNAIEGSAVDAMLSVELGGSRFEELAETPDCVDWNAKLVWLVELPTTAELKGVGMLLLLLLLLLLPTIVVETVVVAMLAEDAFESSGKTAAPVEAPDASSNVLVELVKFAVASGATTVGVILPSTASAVEEEALKVPATLETEYDVSPATPAEALEGVGWSRVLLWDALSSFLTEVESIIKLVPLVPSAVEEADDV
jgi:hypothetical protein